MSKDIIAIGDLQGCYDELLLLLNKLDYSPKRHHLWFAGDLINRGPQSLTCLRYVKQLQEQGLADIVLGNHDLHLLACQSGVREPSKSDTLNEILKASDVNELCDWLSKQALIQYDEVSNFAMTHAGIPPQWSITQALEYASEINKILKSKDRLELLQNMYGNNPDQWHDSLKGMPRYRYIINALTRMRFIDKRNFALNLKEKNELGKQPENLQAWFEESSRKAIDTNIVFGHWAALNLNAEHNKKFAVYHIDTGCVWGNKLSALNLSTRQFTRVESLQ